MTNPHPGPHLGDALSALVDGELSPEDRARATEHLRVCAACRDELRGVATASSRLRALPPVEPPAGFYAVMLAPRRRRLGVAALVLAGAAGVGLLAMRPPPESSVTPSVRQLVEDHAATASVSGDPVSQLVPVGVPVSFGR